MLTLTEFFNTDKSKTEVKALVVKEENKNYGKELTIRDKYTKSILRIFGEKKDGFLNKQITFLADYSDKYSSFVTENYYLSDVIDDDINPSLSSSILDSYSLKLKEFIVSINDEKLRSVMLDFYNKYISIYRKTPASINNHHVMAGGLLVHTVEALEAMEVLLSLEKSKGINRDICIAGIIFHDSGKTKSYINEGDFDFKISDFERKVGYHIVTSMMIASRVLSSVDSNLRDEILHAVASHHGSVHTGSLSEPQTKEAMIVYISDYYSGMLDSLDYQKK